MMTITHYQADINLPDQRSPERAAISEANMLASANSGTTPARVGPDLRARADRIEAALKAGRVVLTRTATISPLTEADFRAGRLTPTTGSVSVD
jgi:hypothetical protein